MDIKKRKRKEKKDKKKQKHENGEYEDNNNKDNGVSTSNGNNNHHNPKKLKTDKSSKHLKKIKKYRKENKIFFSIPSKLLQTINIDTEPTLYPYLSFDKITTFPSDILEFFKYSNFTNPTPIQSQCWPIIMNYNSIVGIAETGSGKTLAYIIPAFLHLRNYYNSNGNNNNNKKLAPKILVLAPTRELAKQIHSVCTSLINYLSQNSSDKTQYKVECLYGGVSKYNQIESINKGINIVIGTPGRILDLCNTGKVSLKEIDYFVLDEADRMLDDGFEEDVKKIISFIQPKEKRKTLLFSATWPEDKLKIFNGQLFDAPSSIKVFIGNYSEEDIQKSNKDDHDNNNKNNNGANNNGANNNNFVVDLNFSNQHLEANKNITQIVEVIEDMHKKNKIFDVLTKYHNQKDQNCKTLLFVLYKKEADFVENLLTRRGYQCVSVHGDKNQLEREKSLNLFITGKVKLMIATDVAARGLDIPDVKCVINYSFPLTIEDYVHRIGRTGRAGKTGISHTFFTTFDKQRAGELILILNEAGQQVPQDLMKFGTTIKRKEHKLYGAHYNTRVSITNEKVHLKFD